MGRGLGRIGGNVEMLYVFLVNGAWGSFFSNVSRSFKHKGLGEGGGFFLFPCKGEKKEKKDSLLGGANFWKFVRALRVFGNTSFNSKTPRPLLQKTQSFYFILSYFLSFR